MQLDTSGLLCLFDRDDQRHREAQECYEVAVERMTHSYILAELVALTHARRAPREGALEFVASIQDSPEIETVYVDEALHRAALTLLRERLDKSWSLCDAVSILLMQQRGLKKALTTDRHFEQAGMARLLPV